MTVEEMKKLACETIDKHADELKQLATDIFMEPELGYKEFKTADKIKAKLDGLGLKYKDGVAVTGIVTPVEGRNHNVKVAIMGELDSVVVPGHPYCDPITKGAHACGHNCQATSVVGVAYGLVESGIYKELDGDAILMHVPSEECVELEFRKSLIDQGVVKCLGGKQEFVRLGVFDDIDMMFMQHTLNTENDPSNPIKANCGGLNGMGFNVRLVKFTGKESHAAMPSQGVNALKAAEVALAALDAQRDTFLEKDTIRIHPIITKGGDLVNVVPADVRIESYIRGSNTDAILAASARFDRCMQAGADALGAQVEITKMAGYMCPSESKELKDVVYDNMAYILGAEHSLYDGNGGSTDAADIGYIVPTIHMRIGGAKGVGHGADYEIADPDLAVVKAAKILCCTAIDLLANGAEKGLHVKNSFQAPMTKDEYLTKWCGLEKGKDF